MKDYKVTIEETVIDGSIHWICRHGRGDTAKYTMAMEKSTGLPGNNGFTRSAYIKLVKKNHANYVITNHMIVPDIDQRVERPLTKEDIDIAKRGSNLVDKNIFDDTKDMGKVDTTTGEVHETGKDIDEVVKSFDDLLATKLAKELAEKQDSKAKETPEPVNSVKTDDMETNNESTAKAEVKSKPSLVSRTIRTGLGNLVTLTVLPIHLGIITAGDLCYAGGGLIAKGEVKAQKLLGRLPETIELEDGSHIPMTTKLAELAVLARTKMIQDNVKRIAVKPISYAKDRLSKRVVETEAQAV